MFKGYMDSGPLDAQFVEDETQALFDVVDSFASHMKAKLATEVKEGRSGWRDPANAEQIYNALLAHAAGVPFARGQEIDIANFAMVLWWMQVGQSNG